MLFSCQYDIFDLSQFIKFVALFLNMIEEPVGCLNKPRI